MFMYVVNQDLLQDAGTDQSRTTAEQMRQMGQSLLLTAQALANSQGVTARGIVRHGHVADEIARTCRELNAGYLVLNPAGSQKGEGYFTPVLLSRFVEQIEKENEISVILSE